MSPLELVQLTALMERTYGSPEVTIGLIDGPVSTQHPDLAGGHLREILGNAGGTCARAESMACLHGTFVAGILCGNRHSRAPAICPNCTLLIRPIFAETTSEHDSVPRTTPLELATAIVECINAGARVINLSLALARPSANGEQVLEDALNQAARRGVIVVAAAGNQSALGGSTITRHPGVIPVASCDVQGRPMNETNLGGSIGRWATALPASVLNANRSRSGERVLRRHL
jgi:subtilisin family serine protease